LPQTAYPVTLHERSHGWMVDRYTSYCPSLPSSPPTSFEWYCNLLDPWESQLLADVHLNFKPTVLISMLEKTPFRACSDGSAVVLEGTYGWSLSLEDGTRLAHGAGPVCGHDPRSFRAEGQGMLSVVCFLRRLTQWTCSDQRLEGVLATDNTGLLARVSSQSSLRYPIPNSSFKSDWDLVKAIVQTVRASSLQVTYEHVKGHQDSEVPVESLDLLAQLNVKADRYAGEYRASRGAYHPVIPLMPTRPVALDIAGKTVHRRFKSSI
jgi:hypothetical protein